MSALRGGFRLRTRTAASSLGLKFLIDNALPPRLAELLLADGHDAIHVRDYAMQAERDEVILTRAALEDRVIVSADTDFGTILAKFERKNPSFILFREVELVSAEDYAGVLIPSLPILEPELTSGC